MATGTQYSLEEAALKLEAYCAYQERCTQEVTRKIESWGFNEDKKAELLSHLENYGYLNNERFAEAFVSGKVRIKRWGRIKIKMALRMKGLPSSLIDQALREIDEDLYLLNLKNLTERKAGAVRSEDEYEIRIKTSRYLASRGFESDLIRNALDDYFSE